MILGIDASNIRDGGGLTHLYELLRAADPHAHGFKQVVVWAGKSTLGKIEDRDWLGKRYDPFLDRGLPFRLYWHKFRLGNLAASAGCDLLFVPGGSDASGFKPMVAMSQNLLPFEWREFRRYGLSTLSIKYAFLRFTQGRTFRRSNAVIFLSQHARDAVLRVTGKLQGASPVIPHGIDPRIFQPPRRQRDLKEFTESNPCRILYVSKVDVYKHQWHVVEAVARLRSSGLSVVLDLVGPIAQGASRLKTALQRADPAGRFVSCRGELPYETLQEQYLNADINVFASSCETFGQILTEAMSAGLPIACSNRSAMPEILGDAGAYFDPESPEEIAGAIRRLLESPELRMGKACGAYSRAKEYSWTRSADETFSLLERVAKENRR
jgi:glycosyltransferase involved in cell wall biosynthesis